MGAGIATTGQIKLLDCVEAIQGINDIEDVLKMIKQVDALAVALKSMDIFEQQAIKYARLHAATLVRYIELGGLKAGGLRGIKKECAEWLAGLTEIEREDYILRCEDGLLITEIFQRDVRCISVERKAIDKVEELKKQALDELKEEGIVDIKRYSKSIYRVYGRAGLYGHAQEAVDRLRHNLRNAGAIGTGEDNNEYVLPSNRERRESIYEAIGMRLESIENDIKNAIIVVEKSGVNIEELKQYCYFVDRLDGKEPISQLISDVFLEIMKFMDLTGEGGLKKLGEELNSRIEAIRSIEVTDANKYQIEEMCKKTEAWIEEYCLA